MKPPFIAAKCIYSLSYIMYILYFLGAGWSDAALLIPVKTIQWLQELGE